MPKFASALALPEQASPGSPPSGWVAVFAKAGGVLWTRSSAGTERLLEPGILFAFSSGGPTSPALTVAVGKSRLYNDTGATLTIKSVRASVGTAPTGSSIIVDININGTTIFSTQGNRPTIAAGGFTSGKVTNMNTATISDGSYFTVDLDAVGSTVAGADLTVQVLC
jgi:hypothetical protein